MARLMFRVVNVSLSPETWEGYFGDFLVPEDAFRWAKDNDFLQRIEPGGPTGERFVWTRSQPIRLSFLDGEVVVPKPKLYLQYRLDLSSEVRLL